MSFLRRLTPRAEKTLRLVAVCALAGILGIIAVAIDSQALGYTAMGLVLVGILAGPVVARYLLRTGGGRA